MTLATLLLALALPAATPVPVAEEPVQEGGLLQDLEIMRHLIARKVAARSQQITGAAHVGWTDENVTEDAAVGSVQKLLSGL